MPRSRSRSRDRRRRDSPDRKRSRRDDDKGKDRERESRDDRKATDRYQPARPGMARGAGKGRGFGKGASTSTHKEINRQEVCPLLLRVFVKKEEHHKLEEFQDRAADLVDDEVQIYTWKDATLLELTQLVQQVKSMTKEPGVSLHFNLVSNSKGKFTEKAMGTIRSETTRRSEDDRKSLQDTPFEIGDFVDIAVVNTYGGPKVPLPDAAAE
eukprot:NODE_7730_length_746_cov_91.608347_g7480_i0.p1 GENE.NODE_7730_length_746_cov_91.608347_g7480_i0~~NODE_7730_length_746_cov_91.608347_g7480_i0.p1  ORF type:complete len:233 (+),score=58.43 NODE_7730_length_746_cov_91.608347_g7480_i0:69-701(+)